MYVNNATTFPIGLKLWFFCFLFLLDRKIEKAHFGCIQKLGDAKCLSFIEIIVGNSNRTRQIH